MRQEVTEGLSRKHLRSFDKEVSNALLALVEDAGVKHRMPDGQHILLYPPDGKSQPFKVSAHRPAAQSLEYIKNFANKWHLPTRGVKA